MDHLVGHVVRRGVQAGHAAFTQSKEQPDQDVTQIPAWGAVLLISTAAVFIGLLSLVEYTCGRVIATLTMIESPSGTLFEPLATNELPIGLDNVKKSGNVVEPELLLTKQQPVTATIRSAIKHLRSRAGAWSVFRGFSLYLVYGILVTQMTMFISGFTAIPRGIAGVFATVIFARLRMGWTHIVISESSPKPWFRRLPSIKLWKKIAVPTAVLGLAEQLTIGIPVALLKAMKLDQVKSADDMCAKTIVKVIAILVLALLTAIAIVIPAMVTLARVQASLLSEDEETIVPFDRSFDGKVVPEIVGGSGMISMLEAWKTFDRSSRVRLFKLYVKVGALQILTTILFAATMTAELFMIMGKDAIKQRMM